MLKMVKLDIAALEQAYRSGGGSADDTTPRSCFRHLDRWLPNDLTFFVRV
jgi:hypothetical protein